MARTTRLSGRQDRERRWDEQGHAVRPVVPGLERPDRAKQDSSADPFEWKNDDSRLTDAGQAVEEHAGQVTEHGVETDLARETPSARAQKWEGDGLDVTAGTCAADIIESAGEPLSDTVSLELSGTMHAIAST